MGIFIWTFHFNWGISNKLSIGHSQIWCECYGMLLKYFQILHSGKQWEQNVECFFKPNIINFWGYIIYPLGPERLLSHDGTYSYCSDSVRIIANEDEDENMINIFCTVRYDFLSSPSNTIPYRVILWDFLNKFLWSDWSIAQILNSPDTRLLRSWPDLLTSV
jgi:hypothetical protein